MSLSLFIARRYLFGHKSHSIINAISVISVLGVTLATMSLVCTLSVFNGFHDLVATLFTDFDPQLKVVPVHGKTFPVTNPAIRKAAADQCVEASTIALEDMALARYNGRQQIVSVKGVDDNFTRTSDIANILYGDGQFMLKADVLDYAVLGIGVASTLGTGVRFDDAIDIYAPRRGERVNMLNPVESFSCLQLYSSGVVFNMGQRRVDDKYIITSLDFAQRLFDQPERASSLELRLKPDIDVGKAQNHLRSIVGSEFKVLDRYEQQEDVFRIMNIEKFIAYLFLSFILIIATFNIIGSISMLMLDKRDSVSTLRSMGADNNLIQRIFLLEGWLISIIGAVAGIALGLLLCLMQQQLGLVRMGSEAGSFIVDAYPVSVHPLDIVVIFLTVVLLGFASIYFPVRYLARKLVSE